MRFWLVVLPALYGCWHFLDMGSPEPLRGLLLPLLFGGLLIAALIRLTLPRRPGLGHAGGASGFGLPLGHGDGGDGGCCGD